MTLLKLTALVYETPEGRKNIPIDTPSACGGVVHSNCHFQILLSEIQYTADSRLQHTGMT